MKIGPIAALLMLMFTLSACSNKNETQKPVIVTPSVSIPAMDINESPMPDATRPSKGSNYAEGKELLAIVKNEEEALIIAELYDIEFLEVKHGIATFHTDEDPREVINRGKENGWPLLEVNYIKKKQ